MVNLGTGFQKSFTRPDEKMSICSSTPQDYGGYTNSSWLESDLEVRKCHAMQFFENLYEPKMEVILTISFKIAAKIEIRKHMFCVLLDLLRRRVVAALYGIRYVLSLP